MRRLFLRLEVLVVLIVAGCLAALSASGAPARPDLELTAGPGDTLTLSNSKEGSAILSVSGMRPGDSRTDTVTLGNTGTLPGDLTLSTSNVVDAPGPGGGALSAELDLLVNDITNAGSPETVYSGKVGAVGPVALGSLAAGASRVYEFRVSFPDGGPGAENAYQGSSMSIQFDWTAFNPEDIEGTPPETTITSAPPALSASRDATFAFSADEAGSTFECSLDGGAYAPCSTPRTYTGLADGAHSFAVRATDAASSTDLTPATRGWTIDATAPSKPKEFAGAKKNGRLVLKWKAATDNAAVGAYLVYANGKRVKTLGASARSAAIGSYRPSNARAYQVAARDTAGNVGPKTRALVMVPSVARLSVATAGTRLTQRGLKAGALKYVYSSSVGAGLVVRAGRGGLVAKGTPIPLMISRGAEPAARASTPPPPPPSYGGSTPPPSSVYTPPVPTGTGSPTVPPQTSPVPPSTPSGSEAADTDSIVPGNFSSTDEEGSGGRKTLGLALLSGAFLAASAVAWRARGARVRANPVERPLVEPIVFWDERLARTLSASIRRLLARS